MFKTIKILVEENRACSLPWYTAEINFQLGTVLPCCKYDHEGFDMEQGFETIWNGTEFKTLRQKIANNEVVPECHKCNDSSKYTYKDFKNKTLERSILQDQYNEATETANPVKHLNFSASNICNLACRMCNPGLSSTWASIADQIGGPSKYSPNNKNLRKYLESLLPQLSLLETMTITGGEPFMDPIVQELIEKIKSPNLKQIGFSTNMTVYNSKLFDMLAALNIRIRVAISIDGPKEIHNYIRYKGSYDLVVENLKRMVKEYPRFMFSINTTCSVYNIGYIKESLEGFKQIEDQVGIKFAQIKNSIVYNSQLYPEILPDNIKQDYLLKLDTISPDLLSIPNSLDMVTTARRLLSTPMKPGYDMFVKFTEKFDREAGTDFEKIYWPIRNVNL